MTKAYLSNFLRKFRILFFADKLRFYLHLLITIRERRRFKNENPTIKLPPDYLIYESFRLNYNKYYFDSRDTANWLLNFFKEFVSLNNIAILDWGCGPARVTRHLPELLDKSCRIYGADYNLRTINWNRSNIDNVNFNLNFTNPPLPYIDDSFDIIYGISIFTHLSEALHYSWFNELVRVSKHNGIILLTLAGNAFKTKLTLKEQKAFETGELITKGETKMGHRTYSSYQPVSFVHKLLKDHQILKHIEGNVSNGRPQQDVWIVRINKNINKN